MSRLPSGSLIAALALTLAPAAAQTDWTRVRWSYLTGPLAYDATLGRFVSPPGPWRFEFDGVDYARSRFDPLWLPLPGANLHLGAPSSIVSYDTVLRRYFAYGGLTYSGKTPQYPTHTWLGDGDYWVRSTVSPNPGARVAASVAFDSWRRVFVLFGGADQVSYLDDTWEFDGQRWRRAPTAIQPPAADRHPIAFDERRGKTVLYDGTDTWEWDGVAWTRFAATGLPAPRSHASLVFDHFHDAVLLIGGRSGLAWLDVWVWNGLRWAAVTPANGPTAREGVVLLSDPAQQVLHVIGGRADPQNGFTGEHWRLTNRWELVRPAIGGDHEDNALLAWDPQSERMLRVAWHGSRLVTRAWESERWLEIVSATAPGWRWYASLATDFRRRRVVFFGGTLSGNLRDDTWEWNGLRWIEMQPVHRPAIPAPYYSRLPFAYDARRARLVLVSPAHSTWEWDGVDWTPRAGAETPNLTRAALAWHEPSGRLVGLSADRDTRTWQWDGATWIERFPVHAPERPHALVEDPVRGRVVCLSSSSPSPVYEWDGTDWLPRNTDSETGAASVMAFDLRAERIVAVTTVVGASEVWAYGPIHPAQTERFGTACPGSLGPVALDALARPWLGDRCTLRAMPLPRDAAILVAGLSDRVYHSLTLPVDLALLGAPGCTLECSIESAHAFGGSGGLGFTHVDIPLQPELRGLEVFVQVLAVDPAANPGGLTSSNALRLRIGSR